MNLTKIKPKKQASSTLLPTRSKVLVVVHSNGWIEVYGDRHIDALIVNRLHTEHADVNLVDQYMESTLSRYYRDLLWPVKLRATGRVQQITPEQALNTHLELELLKEIRGLGEVFNHG